METGEKIAITKDMLSDPEDPVVREAVKRVKRYYYPKDLKAKQSYFELERDVGSGRRRIGETI
jgi:hypothetical protein